ncbi:helix-turn-helix domain-containing protein [Streptomyces sp. NPDC055134]
MRKRTSSVLGLASVPPQARSRFREAVLGTLPEAPDWPQLRKTLIAWAEGGFSLVGAARLLHIHRNTLLYRLDKIPRLSGRPVREPAEGIALSTWPAGRSRRRSRTEGIGSLAAPGREMARSLKSPDIAG